MIKIFKIICTSVLLLVMSSSFAHGKKHKAKVDSVEKTTIETSVPAIKTIIGPQGKYLELLHE
jgi:hypothetical protein